jgi:toxin FitB
LRFLLDTNVVSELVRKTPNLEVTQWLAARDPFTLHISTITFAEIAEGIALLTQSERRRRLESWRDRLATSTGERLMPVGLEIAAAWGVIRARLSREGRSMAPLDAFIAATAEVHDLTVVTRNTRHFEPWGGPLFNPWGAPAR